MFIRLLLAALLCLACSARAEFEVVKANAPDAVGHITVTTAPKTVEANGTITVTTAPKTVDANGTITVTTAPKTLDFHIDREAVSAPIFNFRPYTPFRFPERMVEVNGAENMIHLEFKIPEHAFDHMIVINADGAIEKATSPFKQLASTGRAAYEDTRRYVLIACCVVAFVLLCWFLHHRKTVAAHEKRVRQLKKRWEEDT